MAKKKAMKKGKKGKGKMPMHPEGMPMPMKGKKGKMGY